MCSYYGEKRYLFCIGNGVYEWKIKNDQGYILYLRDINQGMVSHYYAKICLEIIETIMWLYQVQVVTALNTNVEQHIKLRMENSTCLYN